MGSPEPRDGHNPNTGDGGKAAANPYVRAGKPMRERMLAGEPYIFEDPSSIQAQQRAVQLAEAYGRTFADTPNEARRILAELLGSVGPETVVRPPIYVDYGANLHLGARTFVNFGLVALDVVEIRLGDDCQLGPNVQLLAPTHPVPAGPRRDKWEAAEPIVIGNNVWLGGGVIVCPGVRIGDNTIVGAGAVVTKNLPANVIAVGNPARVLRDLPADPVGYQPPA